jgi:hypothetical protein
MNTQLEQAAFERAVKYICTIKCGLCPMAVEKFPCPFECAEDAKPWRCWQEFFRQQATTAGDHADINGEAKQ